MEHGVDKTIGWSIYAKMIGGWLFAVLLALLNHVFFAHMDGKDTSYYSENVITASKNTLATAVQLTLVLVEGLALVQLVSLLSTLSDVLIRIYRHGISSKGNSSQSRS